MIKIKLKKSSIIIVTFLLMAVLSLQANAVGELDKLKIPSYDKTVSIQTGNFGGVIITQTELDKEFPCYLQDDGTITCDKINLINLVSLSAKHDISKGIPLTDYRNPVYETVEAELKNPYLDEKGRLVSKENKTTFVGYKTTYLNYSKENKIELSRMKKGIVHIGFTSNVFNITHFTYGAGTNVTIESYGVALETGLSDCSSSGTVLCMQFGDEDNSTHAIDSSGQGNHGAITGAVKNHSWYEFDGVDDRIEIPNQIYFDRIPLTLGVWFKAFAFPTTNTKEILRENHIASPWYSWRLAFGINNRFTLISQKNSSGSNPTISSINTIKLNRWYYGNAVFNGTHQVLYLDGVYQNSTVVTSLYNAISTLKIGRNYQIVDSFNGTIDQVQIWNVSKNATEILEIYQRGLFKYRGEYISSFHDRDSEKDYQTLIWNNTGNYNHTNISMYVRSASLAKPDTSDPGMTSYWTLNQTDGCNDYFGVNNGTAHGDVSCGDVAGPFDGENGTAFDGDGDYITTSAITLGDEFTVIAWAEINEIADNRILFGWEGVSWNNNSFYMKTTSTSQIQCVLYGDDESVNYKTPFSYDIQRWTQFGLQFNKTHWLFFKDGEQAATVQADDFVGGTGSFYMGRSQSNAQSYWNGTIAHVAIYNRSLSQSEILNLSSWQGPYTYTTDSDISTMPEKEYWQYKAILETDSTHYTPELMSVNISDVSCKPIVSAADSTPDIYSATITWTTDENANSTISYGRTTSLGTSSSNATLSTSHSIEVSGLEHAALYYYNITTCDVATNCNTSGPYNFTTLTAAGSSGGGSSIGSRLEGSPCLHDSYCKTGLVCIGNECRAPPNEQEPVSSTAGQEGSSETVSSAPSFITRLKSKLSKINLPDWHKVLTVAKYTGIVIGAAILLYFTWPFIVSLLSALSGLGLAVLSHPVGWLIIAGLILFILIKYVW